VVVLIVGRIRDIHPGDPEHLGEVVVRIAATHAGLEDRLLSESLPDRSGRRAPEGMVQVRPGRIESALALDMQVVETVRLGVRGELREDVVRVLIHHETHVDLGRRPVRDDGLGAGPLIAARQAADVHGGLEHQPLQVSRPRVRRSCGQPQPGQDDRIEWDLAERLLFQGRRGNHGIGEAPDQDPPLRILERVQEMDQPPGRRRHKDAKVPRVDVFVRACERHLHV